LVGLVWCSTGSECVEQGDGRRQRGKEESATKRAQDKVREREAKEREKEKTRPKSPPVEVVESVRPEPGQQNVGPRKLGGANGAADGVAGLTPEMRAKVERERRARAAEARLKALK